MKVVCNRQKLSDAFSVAASVASRAHSSIPALHNVKFTADGPLQKSAALVATDTETSLRIETEVLEIAEPGTVLLHVSKVGAILKECTDETLSIESDGNQIRITGSNCQFKLNSTDPKEYPSFTRAAQEGYLELPARLLRELIRRTAFAIDVDATRFALGGVLFEITESEIVAVGTDGRRLAKMVGTGVLRGNAGTSGVVPARALQLVERLLRSDDQVARVSFAANDVLFDVGNAKIVARLIEGRFPSWRTIIPSRATSHKIPIMAGSLASAIRQAAITSDVESHGIDCVLTATSLTLNAASQDVGQSSVMMPIAYAQNADAESLNLRLKFDHRFLSEFCRVLPPDHSFTLDVDSATTPLLTTTDDGYTYVVMPMALDKSA